MDISLFPRNTLGLAGVGREERGWASSFGNLPEFALLFYPEGSNRIQWQPEGSEGLQKARSRVFRVTLWEQREVPWRARTVSIKTWIGSEAEMRGNLGDLRLCFLFGI